MNVDPSEQKRRIADRAAAAFAARPEVLAVALFGSVARGSAREVSDIDLLVLVEGSNVRASEMLRYLPASLQRPDLSLSTYTSESLHEYLHTWSRFGVHLRREGVVLHDSTGRLAELLAEDIAVSVTDELDAQRSHLQRFSQLDRFGGRLLFPLAHLYRIGRTVIFAQLAQHGRFEFDRSEAFRELKAVDPELAGDINTIDALEPFYDTVRRSDPSVALPFSPIGLNAQQRALEAHSAVTRILAARQEVHAKH